MAEQNNSNSADGAAREAQEDILLARALEEHDRRQLEALDETGTTETVGSGESRTDEFLAQCRARLDELKKNEDKR